MKAQPARKAPIDQYAYRRRAQGSGRERPHRLSVHFLNQVGAALREIRIEWRSVSLVAAASIDRAVEPDAIPAQRAVRDKESPDTRASTGRGRHRCRRRLGYYWFVG